MGWTNWLFKDGDWSILRIRYLQTNHVQFHLSCLEEEFMFLHLRSSASKYGIQVDEISLGSEDQFLVNRL